MLDLPDPFFGGFHSPVYQSTEGFKKTDPTEHARQRIDGPRGRYGASARSLRLRHSTLLLLHSFSKRKHRKHTLIQRCSLEDEKSGNAFVRLLVKLSQRLGTGAGNRTFFGNFLAYYSARWYTGQERNTLGKSLARGITLNERTCLVTFFPHPVGNWKTLFDGCGCLV